MADLFKGSIFFFFKKFLIFNFKLNNNTAVFIIRNLIIIKTSRRKELMGTIGKGVMPAVMTFWNGDESYNEKETLRYVQWVLDKGAHSISCVGSTGDNISESSGISGKPLPLPAGGD
ncbi:MAG: hypothetical protein LIP16_09210 [Clostridium sp.]|nr:hypothetical protein [Clostridium sp.]